MRMLAGTSTMRVPRSTTSRTTRSTTSRTTRSTTRSTTARGSSCARGSSRGGRASPLTQKGMPQPGVLSHPSSLLHHHHQRQVVVAEAAAARQQQGPVHPSTEPTTEASLHGQQQRQVIVQATLLLAQQQRPHAVSAAIASLTVVASVASAAVAIPSPAVVVGLHMGQQQEGQ